MAAPGNIAALFAPEKTILELFYLVKIIEIGVAAEDIKLNDKSYRYKDKESHIITKGSPYFLVNYYEKKPNSEFNKNGYVIYKQLKGTAYARPTHVMFPIVNVTHIGTDLHVDMEEYQWLCDSIGTF